MIRNVRALKEELKERKIINYAVLGIALLTLILFPKILLIIPLVMIVMGIPAIFTYGFGEGVKAVLYYTKMYLWEFTFYNNYERIQEIKEEVKN